MNEALVMSSLINTVSIGRSQAHDLLAKWETL